MFYNFMRRVVAFLVRIFNGKLTVLNKEKLPEGNYILVGPHRTWFDPLLKFILTHANAFPVDRENPGPSAIKTPVKWLRNKDMSLIMFPSGTRH